MDDQVDAEQQQRQAHQQQLLRRVIVGGIISAILVIGHLPMMLGLSLPWIPPILHNPWFQLVITLPVLGWCGQSFFIGAWQGLRTVAAT
jgi:Cu+-exporting ATPase